ncbi:hypothetical protein [Bacillus sp. FJAT-52991]|uniref:Stage II sporulation protein B n=1 Tax=Bacillus kandeliae TaxID=3129297 RepID=A0ABZ2N3Z8_9BACI
MDKPKKQQLFLTISSKREGDQQKKELLVQDWQKGGRESAAATESKKEEEFQWVFPDEAEKKEEAVSLKASLNQQHARKRVIGKLLFIIISAILIGLLFGYTMVKIVTQKEEAPPQAMLKEPKKKQESVAPAAPATSSLLPPIEASIVQGGVFSTKAAAEKAMKRVKEEGLKAGIVRKDEQFILVLGVSAQLTTAKELGETYRANVADVYAKTINIPSSTKATGEETFANAFSIVAEESAKTLIGLPIDTPKLIQVEKELQAREGRKKEKIASLQRLLLDAVNQAKSDQPQAAQAAQEKLLAFLVAY